VLADVVEVANVGMAQRGNRARFAVKALPGLGAFGKMGGENLDGNGAVETGVAGTIDLAHASRTKRRLDFIGTEFCARSKSHGCTPLLRAIITCKVGHSARGDSGWLVG
jgi:hypothetical protein